MKTKIEPILILTGIVIGAIAVILTANGNPANMGFCIACFLRDVAGSLKLHTAPVVQYFRPEIVGIVFGSFIIAFATGEFRPKAGSSPVTRFILGALVMIGALIFLGCPLRMVIRMGGGDLNAFVGLAGFVVGILIGIVFLKKGYGLKKAYEQRRLDGIAFPIVLLILFILVLIVPSLFAFSEKGPGSMHAPVIIAILLALIVGALAEKSRMCMVGGIRDAVMFKNFNLLFGFVAIFIAVLVGNIILKKFTGFSTHAQPIAHEAQIWNFIGMVIVGWGSCLLGGCPLRQLILTGEGNGDSAITVVGMIVGAAFAHNFALAGTAASTNAETGVYSIGGISSNGQVVAICALIVLLIISVANTKKSQEA